MTVEAWLESLGLERYAEAFRENEIDEALLPSLTAEDLRDLGVTLVGHRRRLLNAIEALVEPDRVDAAPLPIARPRSKTGATPFADACDVEGASEADGSTAVSVEPQAERRTLTVLFSDLVGSTELSTRHDPEELSEIMDSYRRLCARVIERFGGYVARYMGDGVLAYFGYPRGMENAPESALRAGLAILEEVGSLAKDKLGSDECLASRVGVATGLVVVGEHIGEGGSAENAISGETPNLAARFQQLAAPGELICGAVTQRLCGGLFDVEERPAQEIKGFQGLIRFFKVVAERPIESRFAATKGGGSARLIGREQEKGLLKQRWTTACEGEGQAVLISGDPGIGKSRLLQDLLAEVAPDRHYRISFQCSPTYRDSALYPALRQLEISAGFSLQDRPLDKRRKLRETLSQIPNSLRYLDDLERFLNIRESEEGGEEATPDKARAAILVALSERILLASQERPVLCILEDAHWIDPSTLDLFTLLLERVPRHSVLVVVTYRPDFDCPWIPLPYATLLKLNRLSRSQSAALVEELLRGRKLPGPLLRDLLEKTDGIPFFIEEMLRTLVENGAFEDPDAAARLTLAIPDSLNDTLLSRLDKDPVAKRVAQVASVIGRDFSQALLAELCDLEEGALEGALESLMDSSIVMRSHNPEGQSYSFKHGLLQEATYGTLLIRTRRQLHQQVARLLTTYHPEVAKLQPEVIARHYDEAGLADEAAEAWLSAGRYAVGRGAYREALQHLESGLLALSEMPETPQRHRLELPLQMTIAETLRSARFTGGEGPQRACARARALCEALGDTANLMKVLRLEFSLSFNRPEIAGIQRVGKEFMQLAERTGDPVAALLAEQSIGCLEFFRGNPEEGVQHLERALEKAKLVKDEQELRALHFPNTTLSYLAYANLQMGRVEKARSYWARFQQGSSSPNKFVRLLALGNSLIFHLQQRNDEEHGRQLAELKELAVVQGSNYWIELMHLHEGLRKAQAGELAEAEKLVIGALQVFKANAIEIEVPLYEGVFAERLLQHGAVAEARQVLRNAIERVERTGERWCLSDLYRLRSIAMAQEEPASALVDLRQALAIARQQGSVLQELRAATTLLRLSQSGKTRGQATEAVESALQHFIGEAAESLPDVQEARLLLAQLDAA
jgi:class 3 adenylate cyclase/tetratricopeptide (TPR) repeat protein